MEVGDGLQADPDPPRPGAADALHALDRPGPPRARDRHGPCRHAAQLRRDADRPRERAGPARPGGDGDPDRPAADDACGVAARPGRASRAQGGLDGEGRGRRRAAAGGRHRAAAARRARLFEGHAGRVDVPLRPPGAAGRWRVRGASHGAGQRAPARGQRASSAGGVRAMDEAGRGAPGRLARLRPARARSPSPTWRCMSGGAIQQNWAARR